MWIKNIELKNYRNYDNLKIDFNNNMNIIIGNNAQGKTNLLESIYVLAVTKSFLSNSDKNLIKFDNHFSKIKGFLDGNNGTNYIEIIINDNGKCIKVNNKEIKRISEYISTMNVIVFSSNDIILFKDSPSSRRKYFNIQISQIDKYYLKYLNDYNILLKQRNEFFKILNPNKENDVKYLNIINDSYVSLSILISKYRKKYIDDINEFLGDIFYSITGIDGLYINYVSNINYDDNYSESDLINRINKVIDREIQYKMTLIGPNRDDFYFSLNGKNLSSFGSQGQIRSAILALKLSEVKLFSNLVGDSPILLLDDIFSELDIVKKNNILKYLDGNIQTIITTTDLKNIEENIWKKANVYEIENGKIISREIIFEQEGDNNE